MDLLNSRRRAADYAAVATLLPSLIRDLHAHAHGQNRRAAELLLSATYAATFTLRHLGYPADAWMAAERCREAAEHLDQPVPLAVADFVRAHASAACVGYRRAASITSRAMTALDGQLGEPTALEVYGMLHLSSTLTTMGQHRRADAFAHIAEAERIAERTGETKTWHMSFGPTNVAAWRLGLEVDAGAHGRAVEIARRTNVAELPASRQTGFYVDLARALAGTRGKQREAIRALLTAERIGPQRARSSTPARETARQLLDDSRRAAGGSALIGLCERMGVPT